MRGVMLELGRLFGRLPKLARWLVVLLIAAVIVWSCTPKPPPPKTAGQIAAEQKAAEIKAAEEHRAAEIKAAAQAKEAKKDLEFRIMVTGARVLKKNMRDPDSFRLENVLLMPSGVVCYEYRAKNGFGGYNRDVAVYQPKTDSLITGTSATEAYAANCAGKVGEDHTKSVNHFLD